MGELVLEWYGPGLASPDVGFFLFLPVMNEDRSGAKAHTMLSVMRRKNGWHWEVVDLRANKIVAHGMRSSSCKAKACAIAAAVLS